MTISTMMSTDGEIMDQPKYIDWIAREDGIKLENGKEVHCGTPSERQIMSLMSLDILLVFKLIMSI
jgi:hypothetical protein